MPEERYYALALDPDKRQVKSITADAGACLAYGIADPDKAEAVATRLMAPDLFSGWGLRTLSSEHPAYNPFAYHLGSVWPSPTAIAAYGLKRYGYNASMHRVAEGLFAATQIFTLNRLPEVFGGHPRDRRHAHPGIYPGACAPQAWSAGAIISLVTTMLGLVPLAPYRTLIVDPCLPAWLPELTLHQIQVGPHRASLHFQRDDFGHTRFEIQDDDGLSIFQLWSGGPCPGQDRLAAALREVLGRDRG